MIAASIQRLNYLCNLIPGLIASIPDLDFDHKAAPDKWSKKEILGHLIDSATNNHQRFVRIQFEDNPKIVYDQNNWNTCSYYQNMSRHDIVELWKVYNLHLARIAGNIPENLLQRTGLTNEPNPVTLQWLFDDYVEHMEHHLKQIVTY